MSACNAGDLGLIPGSRRSPGDGNGTPVFLPGKSHGQRSLVGYSTQGRKKLDMTERLPLCVTQQGLKDFRGREWKCSTSNSNDEASKGQRKIKSEGQRAVYVRSHRGSQGWKRGRMRIEDGVREKSAKSVHHPRLETSFHFRELLIFMTL